MSLLLLKPKPPTTEVKTRTRIGVRNVIWRGVPKGKRVTLEEVIAILRAGW